MVGRSKRVWAASNEDPTNLAAARDSGVKVAMGVERQSIYMDITHEPASPPRGMRKNSGRLAQLQVKDAF